MNLIPNITLVVQIVVFFVLMLVLNGLLFKPMLRIIEERRSRTEGRRKIAAAANADADSIWENYQKEISAAKAQAEAARLAVVREAEAQKQKLIDGATAESDKVVCELRARVQSEAGEARATVRGEIDALARAMAEKILGRAV